MTREENYRAVLNVLKYRIEDRLIDLNNCKFDKRDTLEPRTFLVLDGYDMDIRLAFFHKLLGVTNAAYNVTDWYKFICYTPGPYDSI